MKSFIVDTLYVALCWSSNQVEWRKMRTELDSSLQWCKAHIGTFNLFCDTPENLAETAKSSRLHFHELLLAWGPPNRRLSIQLWGLNSHSFHQNSCNPALNWWNSRKRFHKQTTQLDTSNSNLLWYSSKFRRGWWLKFVGRFLMAENRVLSTPDIFRTFKKRIT